MKLNPFRSQPEVPPRLDRAPHRILAREPKPLVWVSDDDALTQAARSHRCPSHGRSPRARVRLNMETEEFVFEGVCCREAQDAIRALQQKPADEGAEQADDNEGERHG